MAADRSDCVLRRALLAGATGLTGRALLARLLADHRYAQVHVLLRRPMERRSIARLVQHVVDFERLPPLPAVDDVYIALGTTIEAAGSQAAFRSVDFDAVVNTARGAHAAGATRLMVVSALGADLHSRVFYNRVKGEMERAVRGLGYETVVIARPSLLLGDRSTLAQPARAGERWAQRMLGPVARLLPARVRPIEAARVAAVLHEAAWKAGGGVTTLDSAQMQKTR